ncbi:hypothetical protein SNEBB_009629, partial [Seison nebaliae]
MNGLLLPLIAFMLCLTGVYQSLPMKEDANFQSPMNLNQDTNKRFINDFKKRFINDFRRKRSDNPLEELERRLVHRYLREYLSGEIPFEKRFINDF